MPTPPLEGIRVLDLTRLLPGPFCSMLLADFGADVVKVEDLGAGDYLRERPPFAEGVEPSAASASFLALNRGKRAVRVDLKDDAGRAAFLRLVDGADVLLESFRPGVLDRLGVGHALLRERNPRLVVCAITGHGQDGPRRGRAGHDLNYVGLAGVLALTGTLDGPPVQPAVQIGDLGGGALLAAFGILAALRERDRSGEGQIVDVSMTDGALSWLAVAAAEVLAGDPPPRRGTQRLDGGQVAYRPYRCADGWVTLAALEPRFWMAFLRGVGREDLAAHGEDPPGSPAHAALEEILAGRTRAEWEAFNTEHDCCLEPMLELEEALDAIPGAVTPLAQPGAVAPVRVLGTPVRMSRTPGDPARRPAPGLGEHTDELLAEAGYGAEEIAALRASGAVG